MRFLYSFLFSGIVILAAGCSASSTAAPVEAGNQPTAAADPVQTGKQLLEAADWRWLDAPNPVVVQQMSYAEAHKRIPMLSEEYQFWGSQTSVWLVVFKGRWGSMDPAQANAQSVTYEGCLWVLFRAADGSLIAMGTTLCPGQE